MKKAGLIASALLIFVLLGAYGFCLSSAADKTSEKAVESDAAATKQDAANNAAIVNGKAIPMSDYQANIDRLHQQISLTGRQPDEKEMKSLEQRILDDLIDSALLKQETVKRGIKVDDAEVNAQLDAVKKGTTPENFAQSLKQMNMTEPQLKDYFAARLVIKKLLDRDLGSKITVTPEEVKAFYDANPDIFKTPEMIRASHILVKVDEAASPEEKAKALAKIKAVQKRLKSGEDFAKVAQEVSDCPSKDEGGDLNFFHRGQMVLPFEKAAFALKRGETSDIVETEYGYHIIKLTDKKEAGTMSFDEVKPRIEQQLQNDRRSIEYHKYVDALKSKAKIEIFVK